MERALDNWPVTREDDEQGDGGAGDDGHAQVAVQWKRGRDGGRGWERRDRHGGDIGRLVGGVE